MDVYGTGVAIAPRCVSRLAIAVLTMAILGCGSGENTAAPVAGTGRVAFRMRPNWEAADPRNLPLLYLSRRDSSAKVQFFKNGIYLRCLLITDGMDTNLAVDMERNGWLAGEWHSVAVSWDGSTVSLEVDGEITGPVAAGPLPYASELTLVDVSPGADAMIVDVSISDQPLAGG